MVVSLATLATLASGFLCNPIAIHPAFAQKHVALVVGNSSYRQAPVLANPAKDAKAVAAMFQKSGFEVVTAEYDVGIVEFKRAIRKFEDAAADSDIAVVYYSGHGIDIEGANYLVPVDAAIASDRDAEDEAVSLERLVESVDGARRLRIVILDACRDKPFQTSTKHEQRAQALRNSDSGLSAAEPTTIDTLIAYAAKPGSIAEDGNGEHSPFTVALLDNLFVPGLDIRLAFGRVRDEVLKNTSNRQEPFVYGSLGGDNVSVVPESRQNAEVGGEERDYHLVESIGSARAWQVFINQHPTGPFADLARAQIAKLTVAAAAPASPAQNAGQTAVAAGETSKPPETPAASPTQVAVVTSEPPKPPAPSETPKSATPPAASAKEHVAAIERVVTASDVKARDQLRVAQQELSRLGCYSGAVDGAPGAQTTAAIQSYETARGAKSAGNVEITDDFVSELKKQSSRVCPLTCPAGKTAQGEQCVVVAQKPPPAKPETQASAAPARAPLLKPQSASNASKVGIGIGF
jgi:hypothetical protein